jgi:vacuolar-type H+-ATPase subunit I/STV1
MPYYRNKAEFMQPVTIDGKRFVIKPGMVVRVDRELDTEIYSFLEKAEETVHAVEPIPISKRKVEVPSVKNVQNIQAKIKELEEELAKRIKRNEATQLINAAIKETPQVEPAEIEQMASEMHELKEDLQKIADDDTVVKLVQDVATIMKRLEILKKVLQNLESVIYSESDAIVGPNDVVIVDDEEK